MFRHNCWDAWTWYLCKHRENCPKKGIAYIHFRNVIGHAPNYREVFIDEGQVEMKRIIQILKKENYDGVLIPDHAPEMTCDAPWHAGMAFAMGYIKSLLMNWGNIFNLT